MLAFICFLGRKRDKQKGMHRIKEQNGKKQNELLHNTSRFKVHGRRGILYLMTDVSSGDRKGVIFLSFASSLMWCEQFCPGRTFYFDDFYFIGKR